MRVAFYTLGCKVNQTESGAMGAFLAGRGHVVVLPGEDSDAVVINTCTVTAVSDKKSRQAIRRLRAAYPNAALAVCGCLPESSDLSDWDEIDLLGGSKGKIEFAKKLEALCMSKGVLPAAPHLVSDPFCPLSSASLSSASPAAYVFESIPAAAPEGRSRSFLKIQDGCENNCSYCIIPKVRGKCRSRSPEDALKRTREAYLQGYRELVLTGIEISSYRPSLTALIRSLCLELPDMRFRLGSLDPSLPDGFFVGSLEGLTNLCPHFHISLQSGSLDILRAMGRNYTPQDALSSIERLRTAFPGCAVTGDLICGFPGETDEQFYETLDFLWRARFSGLHVFPYSRRPGTPAASMPGQLSASEKRLRAKAASEVVAVTALEYRAAQVGRILDVLFESERIGLSGNYLEVKVPSGGERTKISKVRVNSLEGKVLRGEICD